jgi:(1->4)-alpha-D-glucan 1-alpha-D-glucosylmutase
MPDGQVLMTEASLTAQPRIPLATYRLQFNHQFTLRRAAALVDYLHALGVSDVYASPLLAARPGSLHGYDVVDPTKLNPEVGGEEEFADFARRLKERGMGLVMDVVPNHMCVAGSANKWWNDVLENGPSSAYAHFFDIDFRPPKANLENKTLLPTLGDQYGRVLENQELKLGYRRGAFTVSYYETRLPVAPRTYTFVLARVVERVKGQLGEYHADVLELESIVTALSHLPPRTETDPERVRERRREKEIVKRRLASLTERSREVRAAIDQTITEFNGRRGDAASFDRLEELLAAQAFRLSYWRVAADEINYRRFFDINELAAIRVEEPQVFAAVHDLTFKLMRQGWVTGLRIDHVDGLFDPEQYLRELQRGAGHALAQAALAPSPRKSGRLPRLAHVVRPCYVVVEKILGSEERLPASWPCYGTTGYDFMNLANGLFVAPESEGALRRLYHRFTGHEHNFARRVYACKKLILRVAMSSELHVLARRLDRVSEQHRYTRDFTLNSLQYALGEVIACFPVYRSYIRPGQREVSAEDRAHIGAAIHDAKRRNPAVSPSIFDFISSLLLLDDPDGLTDEQREERRTFVMRFQQLTGPVTAKGVEDTAFYRSYPLASLNEVGGEPAKFGVTADEFHRRTARRAADWPHTMNATATHDMKRGEDVRARLNVLSEIPMRWYKAVSRWRNLNREKKARVEGHEAPDTHAEYLLYQTLVGAWPFGEMGEAARAEFVGRVQGYFIKALKEAKIHSSWISPNEEYEAAARDFVARILELRAGGDENQFLSDFVRFQQTVAHYGVFNSLAQAVLKATAPGVPDYYQGTELWDLSLVDPDNRRPVNYEERRALLDELSREEAAGRAPLVDRLVREPADGRIKLYAVSRALHFRRERAALFTHGGYAPVSVSGSRAANVVAFARTGGEAAVVVAVGRFFTQLAGVGELPVGPEVWGDTSLALEGELAAGCYREVLSGERVCVEGNRRLPLAQAFAHLPVAILERG